MVGGSVGGSSVGVASGTVSVATAVAGTGVVGGVTVVAGWQAAIRNVKMRRAGRSLDVIVSL